MDEGVEFRFPIVRCFTFSTVLLIADTITTLLLWIINTPHSELIDNIEDFYIKSSVFDLVCISFFRCILMITIKALLESMTISSAQEGRNTKAQRTVLSVTGIVILLGTFVYVVVKSIKVLKMISEDPTNMKNSLHRTLCVVAFVFPLVHLIVFFMFLRHLGKLHVLYYIPLKEDDTLSSTTRTEKVKEKKSTVNIRRLISLTAPEKWIIAAGTVGLIASVAAQTINPKYFGNVIQAAAEGSMSDLNDQILILFIIFATQSVGSFVRTWLYSLAGQSIVAKLRCDLFNKIIRQEIAFFDTSRTGELMNRLSSDTQVIQNALSTNIAMLLRYCVLILTTLVAMFTTSPRLGGILIAVVPVVGILASKYGAYTQKKQKAFQDELAKSATSAEESLSCIRTVHSFAQEQKASDEYAGAVYSSFNYGKQLALASGLSSFVIGMLFYGAIVLVLWYAGKLVLDGELNVGDITSFIMYALNVVMAFGTLSSLYGDFMKAVGASTRIFELFDRISIMEKGTVELPDAKVDICFNNVNFNYPAQPDNPVLQSISFLIKPGETVALVGPSGGGKSTCISLLERFYDPLEGEINVGGCSLRNLNTDWFRKRVGIVSQEPVLFATTIAKNIAYGKDASHEEIREAAKQANAHNFIESFEDRYETNVGERGIKLSGGQKQRIAIARALLMDPDILLLDEATSALDAESEHLVQEAIDQAMIGRTVLIIAHRLSTVRNADRVLVISKGMIAEQGSHQDLLESNGIYKKLVLRQLSKGDRSALLESQPMDINVDLFEGISEEEDEGEENEIDDNSTRELPGGENVAVDNALENSDEQEKIPVKYMTPDK